MKRRSFIAGLACAAAWPVMAKAQQPDRMRRIGVIRYERENDAYIKDFLDKFNTRLRELGWIEGHNIHIDYRFAENDAGRLRTCAWELVSLQPDVIFAGVVMAPALQAATSTIPIVFAGGTDPVAEGLVASLAQPGGNVTGFSYNVPSIATKRLQMLRQIAPRITHIALMHDPAYSRAALQYLPELKVVGASIGVEAAEAVVRNAAEIEKALAALAGRSGGGLIVLTGGSTLTNFDTISAGAAMHYIPAIYRDRHYFAAGGLVSYGGDGRESYPGAATYVDRILRGAKPADLPVQTPTKFEFVINLKTAKALGLTIPETLLATADEVIQ